MGTYRGTLQISGIVERPINIHMDLDGERLAMRTSGGEEIGAWHLDKITIIGRLDDGFTFSINGIPGWVRTNNDGAFANEVGLESAPPRLRRLMAANGRAT